MKASTVRAFTTDFPFIQDVKRKAVQQWVNRQAKAGKKPATISRALSELRGYWTYLTSIEAVHEDNLPLEKLSVPRPSSKDTSEDTRKPFEAKEVVRLLKAAVGREDEQLADLIRLGMWSGARLEELSALKVKDTCTLVTELLALATSPIAHFLPGVLQRLHKLPSDTLVYDLRYRLRCQKCRSRDQFTVTVVDYGWPPD